jgi:hypothetical protein
MQGDAAKLGEAVRIHDYVVACHKTGESARAGRRAHARFTGRTDVIFG